MSENTELRCAWTELKNHWDRCAREQQDLRTKEETVILGAMFKQYQSLKALGWSEAMYCPKDGTPFLAIDAGSTGVFVCHYDGEWPKGVYWIHDAGDLWPSNPILWKPLNKSNP